MIAKSAIALLGLLGGAMANSYYELGPALEPITQLHGDPVNAKFHTYNAGNQFVVMDKLIEAFAEGQSDLTLEETFYINLPPGKLLKILQAGGWQLTAPEYPTDPNPGLKLPARADTYSAVGGANLQTLASEGQACMQQIYTRNQLAFMVSRDHPWAGRDDVSMAEFYDYFVDPSTRISEAIAPGQGIGNHFLRMYAEVSNEIHGLNYSRSYLNDAHKFLKREADPEAYLATLDDRDLRKVVYLSKLRGASGITVTYANQTSEVVDYPEGTTIATDIHHLETPANLRTDNAAVGGVWVTEQIYQTDRVGSTDTALFIVDGQTSDNKFVDRRDRVQYYATILKQAVDNGRLPIAQAWIDFLRSPQGQAVFASAGFLPVDSEILANPTPIPGADESVCQGMEFVAELEGDNSAASALRTGLVGVVAAVLSYVWSF